MRNKDKQKKKTASRLDCYICYSYLFYNKGDEKRERKLAITTLSLLALLAVEIQAPAVQLLTMMLRKINKLKSIKYMVIKY